MSTSIIKFAKLKVRSLLPHFHAFRGLVNQKFDIILCTETWLSDQVSNHAIWSINFKVKRGLQRVVVLESILEIA